MATIKSYTDISQSKTLSKILPLESADMRYGYIAPFEFSDRMYEGGYDEVPYLKDFMLKNPNFSEDEYDGEFPCWSLAALLRLIPNFNMFKRTIECRIETTNHLVDKACEPIDAVFEMVVWLKENGKI